MDSIRSSAFYCVLLLALSQLTVSNQHPLNPATPLSIPGVIPGESNLKFCPESRDTDLLQIDRVEVDPTPPLVYELCALHKSILQQIETNLNLNLFF